MKTYDVFNKIVFMLIVAIFLIAGFGAVYLSALWKNSSKKREWKTAKDKLPRATKRN